MPAVLRSSSPWCSMRGLRAPQLLQGCPDTQGSAADTVGPRPAGLSSTADVPAIGLSQPAPIRAMLRTALIAVARQQGAEAAALRAAAAAAAAATSRSAPLGGRRGIVSGLAPTDLSTVLGNGGVEPHSPAFQANQAAMDELVAQLNSGRPAPPFVGRPWPRLRPPPCPPCPAAACRCVVDFTAACPGHYLQALLLNVSCCCHCRRHWPCFGGRRAKGSAAAPPARQAAAQVRSRCSRGEQQGED